MIRIRTITILVLACLASGGGCDHPPTSDAAKVRPTSFVTPPAPPRPGLPNILILVGDDHAGGTLGIDGDPRAATPHLDRLARAGVRFDRAYCNAPVCTASRQSFITGKLPHAVGVTRLPTPLPDDAVTLGDWLSAYGYITAAFGKMHFNSPSTHGFRLRLDRPDWLHDLRTNHVKFALLHGTGRPFKPFEAPAAEWLNARVRDDGLPAERMSGTYYAERVRSFLTQRALRRDGPFLLVVGFEEPHSPFRFPRDWPTRYRPGQFDVPHVSESDRDEQPKVFASLTPAQVRGIQASYYTALSWLDGCVGHVLDSLDASGLARETIVVYLGDNGYMLGQHGRFEKHCLYEPSVRVPLIVRWPGHLPEGRRVRDLVELVDLVPTLTDFAGLAAPPGMHGRSLAPLARDEPGARGHDLVFSEYLENEEAMVRTDRFKLIVGTGQRRRKDGYMPVRPPTEPYERLYDVIADPDETVDLAARPELRGIVEELRGRLLARMEATQAGDRDHLPPLPPGTDIPARIHALLVPPD